MVDDSEKMPLAIFRDQGLMDHPLSANKENQLIRNDHAV